MNLKPLAQLTCANFADAVKTKFRVWIAPEDSLELELMQVTKPRITVTGGARNAAYENFALLFQGPSGRPLPQQLYFFESEALGRFELFIVPVSSDSQAAQYQATFNRPTRAS